MKKLIHWNWLILAITALLVGIYISVFEHFLYDKAYLYFILAIVFGLMYFKNRKTIK
ncbi:MAG: hypothetical protein WC760_10560 [Bacteroidia bacterium]|jgi:hypothetical protein